jgi:hypothetical protein
MPKVSKHFFGLVEPRMYLDVVLNLSPPFLDGGEAMVIWMAHLLWNENY